MKDSLLRSLERKYKVDGADLLHKHKYLSQLSRLIQGGSESYFIPYLQEGGFWIEEITNTCDFETDVPVFKLYNVPTQKGLRQITVRDLLFQGQRFNPVDLIDATQGDYWKVPSTLDFTNVFDALIQYQPFGQQFELKESVIQMFRERINHGSWPGTSTRISYYKDELDELVHDFGYPTQSDAVRIKFPRKSIDVDMMSDLDMILKPLMGRTTSQIFNIYSTLLQTELKLQFQEKAEMHQDSFIKLGTAVRFIIYADLKELGGVLSILNDQFTSFGFHIGE